VDEQARAEIEAIRTDAASSATVILARALRLLRAAATRGRDELEEVAREICYAQPSMAGLRTAAEVVRRARDPGAELERFAQRVERAPKAIARHAVALLALRKPTERPTGEPDRLRVVTCSSSAVVEAAIVSAAHHAPVTAACAESRPALEGRALASRLCAQGVAVELYTDGGISAAVDTAEAVLVGADAIGPERFVNKVGTGALCALASARGVPVYVLAGSEKVMSAELFDRLSVNEGPPDEVWADPPSALLVRNPYFEAVPLTLVTLVITERGPAEPFGGV
jgi:translation initiation factor 2B subunit (eIF-2B alpha/beta/delta family)